MRYQALPKHLPTWHTLEQRFSPYKKASEHIKHFEKNFNFMHKHELIQEPYSTDCIPENKLPELDKFHNSHSPVAKISIELQNKIDVVNTFKTSSDILPKKRKSKKTEANSIKNYSNKSAKVVKNNYAQLINKTFYENTQNSFDLLKKIDIKQGRWENEKKSPIKKSLKIYSHDGIELGYEKYKKQNSFVNGLCNAGILHSFYSEKNSIGWKNLDASIRKVSYASPGNKIIHGDGDRKRGCDTGETRTNSSFLE
ncbi:hypothetical protein SteCoe_20294 [Stentor coeruleus]|uniref:Uncharacterized protein n=1 Tax=Stentor coeruleus TaxID=5963 RepID=A0A1R2BS15_9CILI|nr:hypothetical protein SteCoe_20294 [Stentor coeruleus]